MQWWATNELGLPNVCVTRDLIMQFRQWLRTWPLTMPPPMEQPPVVVQALLAMPWNDRQFLTTGKQLVRSREYALRDIPDFTEFHPLHMSSTFYAYQKKVLRSNVLAKLSNPPRIDPYNVLVERERLVEWCESILEQAQNQKNLQNQKIDKNTENQNSEKHSKNKKRKLLRTDTAAVSDLLDNLRAETASSYYKYRGLVPNPGIFVLPAWDRAAGLLLAVTEGEVSTRLRAVLALISASGGAEDHLLREAAKAVGSWARHYGSEATGMDWRFLVNFESMAGPSAAPSDLEAVVADVHDWLGSPKAHAWRGSESMFYDAFDRAVDELLVLNEVQWLPLEEWLAEPDLWLTSGGGAGAPLVQVEGGKVKRGKPARLLGMERAEVHKLMDDTHSSVASVFFKLEPGKVRLVTSDSLGSYLWQAYLMGFVERALRGADWSILWMSQRQAFEFRDQTVSELGSVQCLPLDQSKFDHYVTDRMISSITRRLVDAVPGWMRSSAERVREILNDAWYTLPASGGAEPQRFRKRNGNVSGWRMTAFINTVCNCAQFIAISRLTNCYQSYILLNALGDDTLVNVTNIYAAERIVAGYAECGFVVNPAKGFLSSKEGEYEKRIARADVQALLGLPLRVGGSILYRKPWRDDLPVGLDRLRELAETWASFARRLQPALRLDALLRYQIIDMSRASGLSEQQVHQWLHTPASAGGAGMLPWGRRWLKIKYVTPDEEVRISGIKLRHEPEAGPYFAGRLAMRARGEFEVHEVEATPMFRGSIGTAEMPRFEWLEPLRVTSNNLLMERAFAEDDPDLLPVTGTTRAVYLGVKRRAGRKLAELWVRGKLKLSVPVSLQWATDRVGYQLDQHASAATARLFAMWKPSILMWDKISLRMEHDVMSEMASLAVGYWY